MIECLSVLSVAILLSDFCLMYFAFSNGINRAEKKNLAGGFLVWSIFCSVGNVFIFSQYGIHAPVYKFVLIMGLIPCFAVFVTVIRRNFVQHVFVFGMSRVWTLILHNFAAIIVIQLFESEQEIIFAHAIVYLMIFVVSLPLARRFFVNLLPPQKFFEDYGKFVAFFPFAMIIPVLLLWSQEPLIHSWQERLSRFYLPIVFFFFYRHILLTTEQLQEQKRTELNFKRMQEQLTVLKEYNRLMQEGREKVAIMRHDLRHSYRLIAVMLQKNEFDAARDYVDKQETLLGRTKVKNFCQTPLLNAALSFYVSRAENLGIKVSTKINLPEKLSTDESDLALLLSNLLENAINACSKQKSGEKIISVTIQSIERQCVLEIINSCDSTVRFDEKNYPQTSAEGHGFGIASLKLFSEKYDAYTDFKLEGRLFRVVMYWRI